MPIDRRRLPADQPPSQGGPWEVIRVRITSTEVLASGYLEPEHAAEYLARHFDQQAQECDWPPTRAQWQRAAAQLRRKHFTRAFGSTYRVRRTPSEEAVAR